MKTLTFYSYKGGLGRSMLLSSMAHILAKSGKRVFALDLDFEAPGLHYKLAPGAALTLPPYGAIDFIAQTMEEGRPPEGLLDRYAIRVNEDLPGFHLMAAGRPLTAEYLDLLGSLDIRMMFDGESNPGIDVFSLLKQAIERELEPDYLLIDARTGLTHIGSVALQLLTDVAVCLFSCTSESYDGSAGVMKSVAIGNTSQSVATEIYPVISRVSANAEGSRLERAFRDRLAKDLPEVDSTNIIVLHTDVSFEVDDRPSVNHRRSLTESTLMSDMLSAARTLFRADGQVMSVLNGLNLPNDLSEAEDLQPPLPIADRMRRRALTAQHQRLFDKPVLIAADRGYVPGSTYRGWVVDLAQTLVRDHGYSDHRIEAIDREHVVWARVPEQMRNGAIDFCGDPYYIKKSRQLLLGYFPFAFVRSFELVTEVNGDVDLALRAAYITRDRAKPWTLREALGALFSKPELNFSPRRLTVAKDTTSAMECQQVVADMLLDGSASQILQKEHVGDLNARLGRDLLVVDHGTVSGIFATLPARQIADFDRARPYLRVLYQPGPVPVGLIYPKEDTQWGRAMADAVARSIRNGSLTPDRWAAIATDLAKVEIDAITFEELRIIASRGMSFDRAFDWSLARSHAASAQSVA